MSREDVDAEIKRISDQEKRAVEDVKKDIGDLTRFQDFLFERRVLETLRSKIKVREVKVPSAAAAEAVGAGVASEASGSAGDESGDAADGKKEKSE